MQMTFNNPKKATPAILAEKVVEILSGLIQIKSPSIYYTGDKINFSFKGGVNIQIKGKLTFLNQIVKLECDVAPKGSTSNNLVNGFVAQLDQFLKSP